MNKSIACRAWFTLRRGTTTQLRTPLVVRVTFRQSSCASIKRRKWTQEEIDTLRAILRKNPIIHHVENLEHKFPQRTRSAILAKASALVARAPKRRVKWSDEENSIVTEARLSGRAWHTVIDSLPGRTLTSIRSHWQTALAPSATGDPTPSLEGRPWTESEVSQLLRLRDDLHLSWRAIAQALHRRPHLVRQKYILTLPILSQTTAKLRPWTSAEKSTLGDMVQAGHSAQEISAVLGRSVIAVDLKIKQLRKPSPPVYWTPEEDAIVTAALDQGRGIEALDDLQAALPNRSRASIAKRYYQHRSQWDLKPRGHNLSLQYAPWTAAEVEILKAAVERGETVKNLNLEDFPGKSQRAVSARMSAMRRAEGMQHKRWTEDEDEMLREAMAQGWKRKEMKERLPGRTKQAITNRLNHLRALGRGGLMVSGG